MSNCLDFPNLMIWKWHIFGKLLKDWKKSLCIMDKAEDLYWIPMLFWLSDDTVSLITVCEHSLLCHQQMPAKMQPWLNIVQKHVFWAKTDLKCAVSKCTVQWFQVGNHTQCVLEAKWKKTIQHVNSAFNFKANISKVSPTLEENRKGCLLSCE